MVLRSFKASRKMASNMIALNVMFKISKMILWISLFTTCLFFVKSIFDQYSSNATSMRRSLKKFEKLRFPTIVFCTDPPMKKTVKDKYNLTTNILMNYIFTNHNETVEKMLEESGYSVDRDYNLSFFKYPHG